MQPHGAIVVLLISSRLICTYRASSQAFTSRPSAVVPYKDAEESSKVSSFALSADLRSVRTTNRGRIWATQNNATVPIAFLVVPAGAIQCFPCINLPMLMHCKDLHMFCILGVTADLGAC
ncbi:hypothetical protein FB567DRAFT_515202 [Paraphoma chrysanthemicola]|uniref:Secreted protein n=1 Tax=Paraphoma chrysanthemicola TaxID=798071 RepID=A0A8K0RI35_9PLEO|nr:hypothetical protein FB567DRAFT_515202 [Paraphoma chrysanthemicola]